MRIIITALILSVAIISCQKEYTGEIVKETPGQVGASGEFRAKINGTQWVANQLIGATFMSGGTGLPRILLISGLSMDKKVIDIALVDSGVHKYTLGSDPMQVGVYIDSAAPNGEGFSSDMAEEEVAGYVEITSINSAAQTISGTFRFKAGHEMDSTEIDVTEGSFTNISYANTTVLPPSSSTDTFHVKVNDTLFTPASITGLQLASNHTITVQGTDSTTSKTVSVNLPDTVSVGSYSIDSFGYSGLYLNGETPLGSVSGTIHILENDPTTKRLRGTFDFKAEDPTNPAITADLTEGYFSIVY